MKNFLLSLKYSAYVVFFAILVGFGQKSFGQTTGDYRSSTSGNWSVLATWQRYSGTGWVAPTTAQGYPGQNTSTANVTLYNVTNVTLDVSPANGIASLQLGYIYVITGQGGTLTFTTGKQLTVNGTVTVGDGAARTGAIDMSAGGILIAQSLSVMAVTTGTNTWTPGIGTVQLTGTNTLPSSLFTSFYNLIIAGATTLSESISVNKTLTLTSGLLTLGSYNLTLSTSTPINGGSSTSYVQTNGAGQLMQTVSTAQVVFPVGNSGYDPLKITNIGTSGVYGVNVADGTPTSLWDPTKAVNESWAISQATAGGILSLVAQWVSPLQEGSNFAAGTTPEMGLWNGTSWSQVTASQSSANTFNSAPNSFSSVGTFAVGKDNCFQGVPVTYYSNSSGTLDLITSWGINPDGSGTNPSDFVAQQQTFVIQNNAALGNNWTISGTGSVVNVGTGSAPIAFTVGDPYILTTTSPAILNLNAQGTLVLSTNGSITGINPGTIDPASTVNFASSTASQTIPSLKYGNLTLSGGGTKVMGILDVVYIAGTFTPTATTYTINPTSTINYNGTGPQTIAAFNYANLTISGARTTNSVTLANSGTIGVTGAFTTSATFTSGGYISTNSTVNYNGTGAQTISAFNYNNLSISGAHTNNVTLINGGTIAVAGVFAPSASFATGTGYVVTNNTFIFNGTAQTIPAFNYYNLSNTNSITLANSGNIGIEGAFGTAGTYTVNGSTVAFNGQSGDPTQLIPNIISTDLSGANSGGYYNIIVSSAVTTNFAYNNNLTSITFNIFGSLTCSGSGEVNFDNSSTQGNVNTFNIGSFLSTAGSNELISLGSGIFLKGTSVVNVTGNFLANGAFLNTLGGGVNAAVNFVGTTPQKFSCIGSAQVNFTVAAGAVVNMTGNIFISSVPITGTGYPTILTVNGTLNCSANVITICYNSTYLTSGKNTFFVLNSGGTLGIGSPYGITSNVSIGTTAGNIQILSDSLTPATVSNQYRQFNTGANYVYNGTAAQVTGVFSTCYYSSPGGVQTLNIAATPTVNNLYIENSATSGVVLSQPTIISSGLYIGNVGAATTNITQIANTSFADGGNQITSTGTGTSFNLGTLPYVPVSPITNASNFVVGIPTLATQFPGFAANNIGAGTTVFYNSGSSSTQVVASAPNYYNLYIASGTSTTSAPKTLGGNVTVNGSLTIAASNTLDATANNYSVTVGGNWGNAGIFNARQGTVYFSGGAASTYQIENAYQGISAGSSAFYNLTHNNAYSLLPVSDMVTANNFLNSAGGFYASYMNIAHTVGNASTGAGIATISGGYYLAGTKQQTFNGGLVLNGTGSFAGTISGTTLLATNSLITVGASGQNSTGSNVVGGVSLTGFGILVAPNNLGTFNVYGNWSQSGTNFTFNPGSGATGGTVTFTGTTGNGTQAISAGSGGVAASNSAFFNIIHTGNGLLQIANAPLTTNGSFINALSAGNFDANSNAHTVTGLASILGASYFPSTGQQTFNGGLTINGSSATFNGLINSLVSASDVNIIAGALTAPGSSGTFTVSGNWTAATGTTFSPNAGSVSFNGSSLQTIGGTASTIFNGLAINNSASGVTLIDANHNSKTVNGLLAFNTGLLTTDANDMLVLSSNSTTNLDAGPAVTSTYYTSTGSFVNGPMQRTISSSTNGKLFFPVGKSGIGYVPLSISQTMPASTQTYTAEYIHTYAYSLGPTIDPQLNHLSGCDYWRLDLGTTYPATTNSSYANGTTANITLYWNPNNSKLCPNATTANYVTDLSTLVIAHLQFVSGQSYSGLWSALSGSPNFGDNSSATKLTSNSISYAGVSTFSPFTLGSTDGTSNPLPIAFDYFNATKAIGYNKLTWKAECNLSTNSFEVERSADGIHFSTISTIKVDATTDCTIPFVYNDYNSTGSKVYYRITMLDINGGAIYSVIRLILNDANSFELMAVKPNPVLSEAWLDISASQGDKIELSIIDITGRQLQRETVIVTAGSNTVNLNTANLAKGMYVIRGIFGGGQTNTLSFIKQ